MSALWHDFFDYIRSLDGVDPSQVKLADAFLRACLKDLRRHSEGGEVVGNHSFPVQPTPPSKLEGTRPPQHRPDAGAEADEAAIEKNRIAHQRICDLCASTFSAGTVRALRAALRTHTHGLFASMRYGSESSETQPPLLLEHVVRNIVPQELGVHCSISPTEPQLEQLAKDAAPYVRHSAAHRSPGSSAVVQHLVAADVCRRYLDWSDQRVNNIHSGSGAQLASAKHIQRRKLVFLISADHFTALKRVPSSSSSSSSPGNDVRYPWKLLREQSSSLGLWKKSDSNGDDDSVSLAVSAMSGAATHRKNLQLEPVHVQEAVQIRCAAGMDARGAVEVLSIIRANLVQWEKAARNDYERRKKRREEKTLTTAKTDELEPSDDAMATPQSESSSSAALDEPPGTHAHFMQVLILVDLDSHTVGEALFHALRTQLLPKIKQIRQLAHQSRSKHPLGAVFDMFPHVVFFGKRILQLIVPPALEYDPLNKVKSSSTTTPSLQDDVGAAAGQLQCLAREYSSAVVFAVPSSTLLPPSVRVELSGDQLLSEVILSFYRIAQSSVNASERALDSVARGVAIQSMFPGGDRVFDKHAMHLLFALWCLGTGNVPLSQYRSKTASNASFNNEAILQNMSTQYASYCESLQKLILHTQVLCRFATDAMTNNHEFVHSLSIIDANGNDNGTSSSAFSMREEDGVAGAGATVESVSCITTTTVHGGVGGGSVPPLIRITYADVLNVVFEVNLVYPLPTQQHVRVPLDVSRCLVGSCTSMTLLAALFASFGIGAVTYEDRTADAAASINGTSLSINQLSTMTTRTVLGFSPLTDVAAGGREFVEECHYAPLQRQLQYLEHCYWPLLIRLRAEVVFSIRTQSTLLAGSHNAAAAVATTTTTTTSSGITGSRRSHRHEEAMHRRREVFVVAVGDDEDADNLDRADKNGELAHALTMPLARVFLIPTPYLVAATSCSSAVQSHDASAAETASLSSNSTTAGVKSAGAASPSAASLNAMDDDASWLLPHVYMPDDADALGRIAQEFAAFLEETNADIQRHERGRAAAAAPSAIPTTRLLSYVSPRICPAAVLNAHRFHKEKDASTASSSSATGPLLPCIELMMEYSSGPYLPDDDSVAAQAGAGALHAMLRTSAGTLGECIASWVMKAAALTTENSVDVQRAKEEALVHAIRRAEKMLSGETIHGDGATGEDGDVRNEEEVSDDEDEDDPQQQQHVTASTALAFTTEDSADGSSSSWWGWMWGGAGSGGGGGPEPQQGGSGSGVHFNLSSTTLHRKGPRAASGSK